MRLTIDTSGDRCSPGAPISLVNVDTGELVGCYVSVVDAQHHRSLIEAADRDYGDDAADDDDDECLDQEMCEGCCDSFAARDIDGDGFCGRCRDDFSLQSFRDTDSGGVAFSTPLSHAW